MPGEPFPAGRPVVVLSPHCDDAAFSVGGLLEHCRGRGIPSTVVTCFSHSRYAPKVLFKTPERVSRIRKQEDAALAASLGGCRMIWLDLPEAPLRKDYERTDVCTSRPLTPRDLAVAAEMAESFQTRLDPASTVLLPFGLGDHVDHRIVREAGLSLAAEGFSSLFLYEDLPYAASYSLPALDAWLAGFSFSRKLRLDPHPVCFPGLLAWKKKAMRCYPSQAPEYAFERIAAHARRLDPQDQGAERVWQCTWSMSRKEPHPPLPGAGS